MSKVVMLVGDTDTSRIVYNAVKDDFNIVEVIQEQSEPTAKFLKRRIRKLGLSTVVGQIAFILVNKFIKLASTQRIDEIEQSFNLEDDDYPQEILNQVESVNSQLVIERLKQIKPDAIVVNGTRIISKKVLQSIDTPFINTHAGITPKYRGVHGGYWALTQQDYDRCGVTVHLVDSGIDTGSILYQSKIEISDRDNFNTYPYLQYAKAIPLIKQAIRDILESKIQPKTNNLPSKLWSHPTIFDYLKYQTIKGVN